MPFDCSNRLVLIFVIRSFQSQVTMNVVYTVRSIHPCFQLDNFTILLFPPDPSAVCALVYLVLGLLSAVTVCGNLLVIISIVYFKQLHIPTNYLILSLAVADLLVGVVVFPFSMAQTVTSCLYEENIFCKIRDWFDITLSTSSILNLCCISIDRYYAICNPLTYKSIVTVRVTGVMIFMTWSLAVMIGIGIVISGYSQGTCEKTCTVNVVLSNVSGPFFSFFMPAVIMLCIYTKIFFVAQRQRNSIQVSKCGAISKTERKATKTLAIVMGVFLLCMTPYFLCIVFLPFASETPPFSLIEALNWLTLSNSMLNPFIYAFFYSWFRSACKVILRGQIFTGNFANIKLV
ncbi:LOW QUALITY PROTEIN: trace amine-associated receptor 1-like [Boleophthalmus pectinirostris]|uniref:LOW QUALITY PROTEIN: trace amine-associated receptor 1-like n=1 Tax=Boleophthalmus pectinirostris TaxID=150288 RepID=UPI00242E1CB3|nr:LOW QUALITY PROTEIN: trace amine-associated receptor 1-like [Boleophthalmus pectinirostris]